MITSFRPAFGRFLAGASVVALGVAAQPAQAQAAAAADSENPEEIIVTGIRASLLKSLSLKR